MGLRNDFAAEYPIKAVLEGMGVKVLANNTARCPFHDDNNPSFSVDFIKGSWKCFAGCGQGGIVELIARRDNKTPDAVLEEYRNRNGHAKKNTEPVEEIPNFNWRECVEAFTQEKRDKLCEWRGYSAEFVDSLVGHKLIGICEGRLSFPIYAAGRVIGTHQRTGNAWITRGGRGSPWVIGDHFENVLIFESQWDAFALMDSIKWFSTPAISSQCSIVITRGANRGKEIQNLFPTTGRIVVWMQNDQPDDKGHVAADSWLSDIIGVVRKAHVCRPPKEFKDVNDWVKDGLITSDDLIQMMDEAELYRDPKLPVLPRGVDFDKLMAFNPKTDPDCLIGHRYLCRGGSAMWVGGSGLGKSVMTFQTAIHWALGDDFMGLRPKMPLRSVILSAEDDEGDLAEVFQGVAEGMGIKTGTSKYELLKDRILLVPENKSKGLELVGLAQELVLEHRADMLWINPLLSYYIGNPSDAEKAAEFCGALTNMQIQTRVCTNLVHHTGKPKDSKTTEGWSIDDYSYIGLGSSVWTNWVRAILVLQGMKEPKGTFVLRFAKRGARAGIVNSDFEKAREVYLKHAETGLSWLPSEFCPNESENKGEGRPSKASWSKVNEAWDGMDKTTSELKGILRGVLSISDKTAWRAIEKWSGIHITKNDKDLWVKISD